MRPYPLHTWRQAPFLRLIIPFIAGIVAEWYGGWPPGIGWVVLLLSIAGLLLFNARFSFLQFRFRWVNGFFVHALLLALGALLCWYRNPAHGPYHLSKYYHPGNMVIATLEEPMSEKANSFKTTASVSQVSDGSMRYEVTGTILLYFKKDSAIARLGYGRRLLFRQPLQPIRNTTAFDYRGYMAFQGIYQQVHLKPGDFVVLPGREESRFKKALFRTRKRVTDILSRYIPGRQEAGLAEALLIGYKDDLDKSLLQSYSNTGVVHIIAISGLHVGLIYWLLALLTAPMRTRGLLRAQAVIILTCLWLFALLAGGGPSVLRSALMFSCMVIGERFFSRTSVYNTLAASAFILLCIDPYWCWDIGFQLSYIAVLSIVIFMKPIYHLLFVRNKLLDGLWKLNALTLAAQVLTVPLTIYHFHQFPNYFLFTNLLAVPLSSCIVLGEIILCALSAIPALATPAGKVLGACIRGMDLFIGWMEHRPAALWSGLEVSLVQLVFLYIVVAGIACWLMQKSKTALLAGLSGLLGFAIARAFLP